jgi:cell division protein FtsA
MFGDSNIIAGLEIGTSKICVVVGELSADGALNIIGVGQSPSRGVRKGEVINPADAEEDLRVAVAEAEQMADVEIRSVYLGVTGGHIKGFNNRGFHPVVTEGNEISQEDVQDVVENAKAINLPAESTLIHSIRQHFLVDGQGEVSDPVGMHGVKLEVDLHVIHGKTNRLQNAVRLVRATSLEVNDIVFNGLASSLALLTSEQKELGALAIDLGGGTTEYVVYSEGVVRHSGVLAIGGDHVANDLAYGLKISLRRAEKLKREHGSAILTEAARGRSISITNDLGLEIKQVKAEHVQMIMSARLEEIFKVIAQELTEAGLFQFLRAGVVLCGGGSRVPGIVTLAEETFGMTVTLGQASAISGQATALNQPEFATAIGLVKYGALRQSKLAARPSFWARVKEFINMLLAILRYETRI